MYFTNTAKLPRIVLLLFLHEEVYTGISAKEKEEQEVLKLIYEKFFVRKRKL